MDTKIEIKKNQLTKITIEQKEILKQMEIISP